MSIQRPEVSLVLPTFNHLRYLPRAVDTALAQTFDNFELIIVNDGSTDGTQCWLDALRDPRIRVIHQDNRGPADAINSGVRVARGEYLSWISADNYCAPYYVEAFVAALDADQSSVIAYSPFYMIDAEGRIDGICFDNLLLLRELVTNRPRGVAGFMYRKSVHNAVGMYEGWAMDTLMWSKVMERFSAVFVLEPTYYYRFHAERATVTQNSRVAAAAAKIAPAFLARHDIAGSIDAMTILYPGLSKSLQLLPYAKSDFAARLVREGFVAEALRLLESALATAGQDEILRPLINAVAACTISGVDPIVFVVNTLKVNAKLSREVVEAAVDLADALALIFVANGTSDLLYLEVNNLLLALEKPKVFSYTAWRHDKKIVPVPGT